MITVKDKNLKLTALIRFRKKGPMLHQILVDMREILGNDAPSQATIFRWTAEFQQSKKSI